MTKRLNVWRILLDRPGCNSQNFRHFLLVPWTFLFSGITLFLLGALSLAQAAQSVSLAWNADPPSTFAGYDLHYGTSSGNYSNTIDVGNTTTATVSNLTPGQIYYFVVTAYNSTHLQNRLRWEARAAAKQRHRTPQLARVVRQGGAWCPNSRKEPV